MDAYRTGGHERHRSLEARADVGATDDHGVGGAARRHTARYTAWDSGGEEAPKPVPEAPAMPQPKPNETPEQRLIRERDYVLERPRPLKIIANLATPQQRVILSISKIEVSGHALSLQKKTYYYLSIMAAPVAQTQGRCGGHAS